MDPRGFITPAFDGFFQVALQDMQVSPMSAADQAAIDKRLTFMEVKDMAVQSLCMECDIQNSK